MSLTFFFIYIEEMVFIYCGFFLVLAGGVGFEPTTNGDITRIFLFLN